MELERRVVLWIAGVPVTTTVVSTTGMVAVLSVLAVLAGRTIRARPSRWQAVAEWGVRGVEGLLDEVVGDGRRYLPLVATLGLFILVANLMSALPAVEAPTADVNTPAALAIIVFCSVHYYGMREAGVLGYFRRFTQPVPLLLPINILSNLTRTFSLAIRLFGNMVSHQIIVAILLLILPLVVPAVLEVFGMFISVLQAYIFTVLTIVYIGGAVRAGGEL
ncbi:MAG TPA: F0F1 ATP synthase subunit A [bacterium]|nr:F0F1 ATP synthase subunit A [bacterium]